MSFSSFSSDLARLYGCLALVPERFLGTGVTESDSDPDELSSKFHLQETEAVRGEAKAAPWLALVNILLKNLL